ncbi:MULTISPECIES: hypothetical protein [Mycobacterium]|uniref:hypothetical protein n=1 Tax=Mycobacterium TaxID=1763 RepID=UPI001EE1D428|nr:MULTISPECIES: hypothetical protein [Mycobacterium]GLB87923.1 hypothetical protein SRL2020130_07400 [Mycobacterium kiyosense]GLC12644.1 hypothetical protein SRL2020448_12470 [Mycobacterium kiyosense]
MVTRVLSGIAIALCAVATTGIAAGADPSVYSVLSCSCSAEAETPAPGAEAFSQQVNDGIALGLAELQDFGGPANPQDLPYS